MKPNYRLSNRLWKWKLFSVLPGLMLAHAVLADDTEYQNPNYAVLNYIIPGNPPPQINATIFDNEGTFNVTFEVYSPNPAFFETWNTLNYTNNGLMTANAPGAGSAYGTSAGAGFWFDQQTTNRMPHSMAGTFYNPGTVRCNSFLDGNDVFFSGTETFSVGTIGECLVSATNVANPGTIEVGVNSLIQLNGQNVDLSRSTLNVENLQSLLLGDSVGVYSIEAGFGSDTNFDWNPYIDLTATMAYSSYPFYLYLDDSTSYFHIDYASTNLTVIRAVFVQNTSPNVSYNVYIEPDLEGSSVVFAPGAAHVEWVGTVNDPATCGTANSYLYLTDDYVLGASTNVAMFDGTPDNFTFVASPTPLLANPIASGFDNGWFPDVAITNPYSFFEGQVIVTTTPTNATPANPSGALTNLPGRIQVTANNELNLNLAAISGQNYLSLTATNQFDCGSGAQIVAPYSDINVGATNGFLAITNLLESAIPNWNGFVSAWSTRFLMTVTNSQLVTDTNGVVTTNIWNSTNDFRVLLVSSSQLSPVTAPQVQNLRVHATNSLVITDVLNVFGSLFIDAQNLTVATNGCGNGATSIDGELNLESSTILWPNALPNLRNLTNSGAIRTGNLAAFGSATTVYVTNTTPAVLAVAATGTLKETNSAANVPATNWVTIGTNTYTFFKKITNSTPRQVAIAGTFDSTMNNLIAAINHGAGSGTSYSSSTTTNPQVTAGSLVNHAFTVTAKTAGLSGDSIGVATSSRSYLNWNGATLSGGVTGVVATTNVSMIEGPYDNFINTSLIADQGSTIYANNFLSSGTISNGVGSFNLQSQAAVLAGGSLIAGGDVSIATGSLEANNLMLQAGRSLTLRVTNRLTDDGVYNGHTWFVGGGSSSGLNLLTPVPANTSYGDLNYTTIYCTAPSPNKQVVNTWAAQDLGAASNIGYTNNAAVGRLILDALGAKNLFGSFAFNGVGTSNALYVDELVLLDYADYTNHDADGNLPALVINTNLNGGLVIYYSQAVAGDGTSVAVKLNHKNNDHLRWVTNHAGYFSSTNVTFGDGTTYPFNAALGQSYSGKTAPFGTINPTNLIFTITMTNKPVPASLLQWQKVTPGASYVTNYVFYKTNLIMANWLTLTNFITPASPAWPPAPVMMSDPVAGSMRAYRVRVDIKQ
jgi:hypothetical protein